MRVISGVLAGVVCLAAIGFAGWLFTLPPAPQAKPAPDIPAVEAAATLAALKPPKRERPVIAVIAASDGAETTDYLLPIGVFRRADIANVVAVATTPGPVSLFPALKVQPDATTAEFDEKYPEGADYVIVPAMHRPDDPAVVAWLKAQSSKGATIVGVCVGATVVAAAGLLEGKQGTTHWYSVGDLKKLSPTMTYVPDRRIVTDKGVVTTTGITASIPMALMVIEAISGRTKAEEVAHGLGVASWDARHDSGSFIFNRPFATTIMGNALSVWKRETRSIELTAGIDEVSLALVADAWSRTYRSQALTYSADGKPQRSRGGLMFLPDQEAVIAANTLPALGEAPPPQALDDALTAIGVRYGQSTSDIVAMQLEYPRP